jgi:hypothetical protein
MRPIPGSGETCHSVLDVDFQGDTRKFVYRHDSVGDRGVIQQIFCNEDYRLTRFPLYPAFARHGAYAPSG